MIRRALPIAAVLAAAEAIAAAGAGPSKAVDDKVIEALGVELDRSLRSLRIQGAPDPYFINYKLTEVEVNDAAASLGATTSARDRHFMNIEATVHIGNYDLDNSNFIVPRDEATDGVVSIQLPLEATPSIARRAAWLVTDAAYKEALEQLTAKRTAMRSASADTTTPSYSKGQPLVMLEPVDVPELDALDDLEARARRISNVFRDQEHIRESRVAYTSFLERRWYLNSEGVRAHDVRRVSGVIVVATAQADDGQGLVLYTSHYGKTMADLPSEKELTGEALGLSKTLADLRKAPLVDNYTGPVLFEGRGAVGVVRETLTHHLSGTPLPFGLASDTVGFGSGFADRIGLRVLSPLLTMIDDPTAHKAGKQAIIGGYRFDDEAIPAQRVDVIKDGALKTLLMSKTPSAQIPSSNGHARKVSPGGVLHGTTTNLFVSGKGGQDRKALLRKLGAEARAQGLPYGLVIKLIDDSPITADAEMTRLDIVAQLQAAERNAPPAVLLAYRVYPDGREELVRGVELKPVPLRAWKDLLGVGRTPLVVNYLASNDDETLTRLTGGGPGFVPSSGVESSIVTPDLLFKELDVRRSTGGRRSPPAVPRPK